MDSIISLALTCERLRRLLPERNTAWTLEQVAYADLRDPAPLGAGQLAEDVKIWVAACHPESETSQTLRIDCTLRALTEHCLTPPGGWSSAALASFCGCSQAAILQRQSQAIAQVRRTLSSRGITSRAALANA